MSHKWLEVKPSNTMIPVAAQPCGSGRTWLCKGRGATGHQSRATPRKQTVRKVFVPEERLSSAASSHFGIMVSMDLRTELR